MEEKILNILNQLDTKEITVDEALILIRYTQEPKEERTCAFCEDFKYKTNELIGRFEYFLDKFYGFDF